MQRSKSELKLLHFSYLFVQQALWYFYWKQFCDSFTKETKQYFRTNVEHIGAKKNLRNFVIKILWWYHLQMMKLSLWGTFFPLTKRKHLNYKTFSVFNMQKIHDSLITHFVLLSFTLYLIFCILTLWTCTSHVSKNSIDKIHFRNNMQCLWAPWIIKIIRNETHWYLTSL